MTHPGSRRGARPPPRRLTRVLRWTLSTALLGCVLDSDDRCGPYQALWDDEQRCVCEPGAANTPTGCVPCGENEMVTPAGCACMPGFGRVSPGGACAPCGEHEVTSPNGCICEPGYSRATPGGPCEELEGGGAGSACSTDAECMNPDFSHCHVRSNGTGYCTNLGCTGDGDCVQGFSCVTTGAGPVCLLPPEGAGRPCASDADCEGSEALFCDLYVSLSCLVRDCTVEPNSCFTGMECCIVGGPIPPICIPEGACQS